MSKVILAHLGPPCDPPIVNGVVFRRAEGQLWLGETDEATAQLLTRIPTFRRYGGKLEVPCPPEEAPVPEVVPPEAPDPSPVTVRESLEAPSPETGEAEPNPSLPEVPRGLDPGKPHRKPPRK